MMAVLYMELISKLKDAQLAGACACTCTHGTCTYFTIIINNKVYKYQCVTAFVALYVSMYVCMYHISLNNGPGVYYL